MRRIVLATTALAVLALAVPARAQTPPIRSSPSSMAPSSTRATSRRPTQSLPEQYRQMPLERSTTRCSTSVVDSQLLLARPTEKKGLGRRSRGPGAARPRP